MALVRSRPRRGVQAADERGGACSLMLADVLSSARFAQAVLASAGLRCAVLASSVDPMWTPRGDGPTAIERELRGLETTGAWKEGFGTNSPTISPCSSTFHAPRIASGGTWSFDRTGHGSRGPNLLVGPSLHRPPAPARAPRW